MQQELPGSCQTHLPHEGDSYLSVNHNSLGYSTKSPLIHWFCLYQKKTCVQLHGQTLLILGLIYLSSYLIAFSS